LQGSVHHSIPKSSLYSSHNAACIEMHCMIKEALIPMGLFNSLQEYPCAIIRSSPVATRGKQSENSWGPKSKPPDLPTSPSVTLEVGYSESDSKLTSDARFWLSPGHGCANICLTVLINRSRPEIGIKRWSRASKTESSALKIFGLPKRDIWWMSVSIHWRFHSKVYFVASQVPHGRETQIFPNLGWRRWLEPFGKSRADNFSVDFFMYFCLSAVFLNYFGALKSSSSLVPSNLVEYSNVEFSLQHYAGY
jgi:hypothetical protein